MQYIFITNIIILDDICTHKGFTNYQVKLNDLVLYSHNTATKIILKRPPNNSTNDTSQSDNRDLKTQL